MISLLPNLFKHVLIIAQSDMYLFKQALIYSVCLFKQVRSYKNVQSITYKKALFYNTFFMAWGYIYISKQIIKLPERPIYSTHTSTSKSKKLYQNIKQFKKYPRCTVRYKSKNYWKIYLSKLSDNSILNKTTVKRPKIL